MDKLWQLLKNRYFWYITLTAFLAGISSYAPQLTGLINVPVNTDWQVAYYVAAYRLLLPISALIAAWRFGVKGGLIVCVITGTVILSSVLVNSRLPNAWIDVGDVILAILISWFAGKQGELTKRLEENATELQKQSTTLKSEIAERKQAEERIERVYEQWQTTFNSITDRIYIVDNDFKLVRVNKAFADAVGRNPEELIGDTCYRVLHRSSVPIVTCPLKKMALTKAPVTAEYFEPSLGIYLDITSSPILDDKGEVIGAVLIARDIAERKRMQEQLMLTDRLASVGELASGIAHEINNPLTSIITFSQLLSEKDLAGDIKEDLATINSEARRTAEIVKNLLTFARKHPPKKQPTLIHNVIEDALKLRAYNQQQNNIEVYRQFAPDIPEIMADNFQLQQVFFNIIINAEYFMILAHNRGRLTITTEKVDGFIRVSFADDGPGIQKENLSRLFAPFFTTKEVGKGTGLGLSICHGIVAEHGGRIYARSEQGGGSTFVIELPVKNG